ELSVEDNGRGIARQLIPRLGQKGQSFDKPTGHGLGLYHARTHIERWGGALHVTSKIGVGTKVKLTLPKAVPPRWFVPEIGVYRGVSVVVVDDDASIHQIWEKRFAESGSIERVSIIHLSTPDQLRRWKSETQAKRTLYLVDFEFLG